MKLNLLFNQNTVLAGYNNIDPFLGQPADRSVDKINGDILNLDWIVEDGTCEEIRAYDIIDFIDMTAKPDVLQNWMAKLAKGGKLTIGGNDLNMVARAIYQKEIDFNVSSTLLYGNPENISSSRCGLISLPILEKIFQESTLKVINKQYDGKYRYLIQGERN